MFWPPAAVEPPGLSSLPFLEGGSSGEEAAGKKSVIVAFFFRVLVAVKSIAVPPLSTPSDVRNSSPEFAIGTTLCTFEPVETSHAHTCMQLSA